MQANLPEDMKGPIKDLEYEASRLLALKNFNKSEEIYTNILTQITERQSRDNRRIHQGAPLHMKGISLLFQNKFKEALEYFLLAYTTDTVNCSVGDENSADQAPAYNILKGYYNVNDESFDVIKNYSKNNYINRHLPFNPQEILSSVLLTMRIEKDNILKIASRIPSDDEISSIMVKFFKFSIFDSSSDKTKLNQTKLINVLNRLIEVPKEIRNILPELLSKPEINIMNILTDNYYLLVFLDDEGWDRVTSFTSQGLSPFPGLIKTPDSQVRASIDTDKSKNLVLENVHISNNFTFSLVKDSTLIVKNHRQQSADESFGIYDYNIEFFYLIFFGDEITVDNFYDYLEDLIAYSFKMWRS